MQTAVVAISDFALEKFDLFTFVHRIDGPSGRAV
jgi:hypothetical protein